MYNPASEYNSKKLLEETGLFFVGKKMVYLSLWERGKRNKTVGFAELVGKNNDLGIRINIKNKDGNFQEWPEIQSIKIIMENGHEIIGEVKKRQENEKEILGCEMPCKKEDLKWKQIMEQYKKIHPFGDERECVAVELKDLALLAPQLHKLTNNSFLLHGFYNYRHLILAKKCGFANPDERTIYLGVPGVYYEREKQVAIMFGFQGFECVGQVEVGKFGYYMKEVQI